MATHVQAMYNREVAQININVTADFERDLKKYMQMRAISEKSRAIREALKEAVERLLGEKPDTDFRSWVAMTKDFMSNPSPRFKTEDDLWDEK